MDTQRLYPQEGSPFTGRRLQRLTAFLAAQGLQYDAGITYTVMLVDGDGTIAATGSLQDNILKCIAVAPEAQGQNLTGTLLSYLCSEAARQGRKHLFLFTKPGNETLFRPFGFTPVVRTEAVLLMENPAHALETYLASLRRPPEGGSIGAIVMNANPFTLGHRYLVEQAAAACDSLHLFVVSEDKSRFSAELRYRMVEAGVRDFPNVYLHRTEGYLISAASFPTYFIKEHAREANCRLDIALFCSRIAPRLGITRRFVGQEPEDLITRQYNEALQAALPGQGITVTELPRLCINGVPVSASRVRQALDNGDWDMVSRLVPETTSALLREAFA